MGGLESRYGEKTRLVLVSMMLGLTLIASMFSVLGAIDSGGDGWTNPPARSTAYSPHSVIEINSDADFASQASSEGWPGSGVAGIPYVIAGYDIDASGSLQGVLVGNTTVHFEVASCYVHGATESGVMLYNSTHATITDNECDSNGWYGVLAIRSTDTIISNNSCQSNRLGVGLRNSQGITVVNNTIIRNGDGLQVSDAEASTIERNNCSSNSGDGLTTFGAGVYATALRNSSLIENTCGWNDGSGFFSTGGSGNVFTNNTATGNNNSGVEMNACSGDILDNNHCNASLSTGIHVLSSDHITIRNQSVFDVDSYGIYLESSSDCVIENISCSYLWAYSINLLHSFRNTIVDCNLSDYSHGVSLTSSDNNTIERVRGTNTLRLTIRLFQSNDNDVGNCTLTRDETGDGIYSAYGYRNHVHDNSVQDCETGINIGEEKDGVFERNICSSCVAGIRVTGLSTSRITNNTCTLNSVWGIRVTADSAIITWNNCSSTAANSIGMAISDSWRLTIENNTCSGNWRGMTVGAWYTSISNNTCSSNTEDGVFLIFGTADDRLMDNTCEMNGKYGIELPIYGQSSSGVVLRRNALLGNGIFTTSDLIDIDGSNTVNGKPVEYYVSQSSFTVPLGAGQVILVACSHVVIEDQNMVNASISVILSRCTDISVKNCTLAGNCLYGIYVNSSDDNHIERNSIFNNSRYGAFLFGSGGNLFVNNTFYQNNGATGTYDADHAQAYDSNSTNLWSDGSFGNYWSDWQTPDFDFDGIVDVPYSLAGNSAAKDHRPLTNMPVLVPEMGDLGPALTALLVLSLLCVLRLKRNR
jgi:parallel beta-helix repeat protein